MEKRIKILEPELFASLVGGDMAESIQQALLDIQAGTNLLNERIHKANARLVGAAPLLAVRAYASEKKIRNALRFEVALEDGWVSLTVVSEKQTRTKRKDSKDVKEDSVADVPAPTGRKKQSVPTMDELRNRAVILGVDIDLLGFGRKRSLIEAHLESLEAAKSNVRFGSPVAVALPAAEDTVAPD